jgi:hypothetical protein
MYFVQKPPFLRLMILLFSGQPLEESSFDKENIEQLDDLAEKDEIVPGTPQSVKEQQRVPLVPYTATTITTDEEPDDAVA